MALTTRRVCVLLIALVLALCSTVAVDATLCKSSGLLQQYRSEIGITLRDIQTVMVTMRDGVQLSTTILFPLTPQSTYPAVIDRSPYGHHATELIADAFIFAGFVGIGQDMRGTCESQGNFTMWRKDSEDGYDTMAWIAAQPWSNKRIYQIGASADGVASFVMSKNMSPYLKGQAIVVATGAAYQTLYPGGAYRKNLLESWLEGTVPTQAKSLIEEVKRNERPGPWWNSLNMTASTGNVTFPIMSLAGWNDIFIDGNILGFDRYQKKAAPSAVGRSYLVVDPLGHCQAASKFYPKNLIMGRIVLPFQMAFDLFQNKSMSQDPDHVTFYVMGANDIFAPGNYWTSLPDWPAYTPTPYYISSARTLSPVMPTSSVEAPMEYKFDPLNPVPTIGGVNLALPCGPLDQNSVEEGQRSDVLTFTTAAFTEALYITGPVNMVLYGSTSAADTDFTAKFTDVYPDGSSHLLGDGIVRMRWRAGELGGENPMLPKPHRAYRMEIQMLYTSYVFAPGHKLRVTVSSSNYPRFDVNYGNGLPVHLQTTVPAITQINRVFSGNEYPSAIILPVVKPSDIPERKFYAPNPTALKASASSAPAPAAPSQSVCESIARRVSDPRLLVNKVMKNPLYIDAAKFCGVETPYGLHAFM